MRGTGQELGEPAGKVSHQRRVRMLGRGHVGHVDPLVRPAAIDEVAAQGLPPVEAIARHATVTHERERLRGNHLDAGGRQRKRDAEHVGEEPRLRARRDDDGVGAERPSRGLHGGDAAAAYREPGHRRVLEYSAAVILERPGIRLHRALRIGVASEVQVGATDRIVAGYGHQLLELLPVEQLPAEAPRLSDLGPAPGQRELRLAERDADPVRLMLAARGAALRGRRGCRRGWRRRHCARRLPIPRCPSRARARRRRRGPATIPR